MKRIFAIALAVVSPIADLAFGQAREDARAPMYAPAPRVQPQARTAPTPRTFGMTDLFPAGTSLRLPPLADTDVRVTAEEGNTQTGRVFDFSIDPVTAGNWTHLADGGMVWTVQIESPNAASLRLRFEAARLPRGSELIVYHPTIAKAAFGPYGPERFRRGVPFWSPSVRGNRVNVEFYLAPAAVEAREIVAPAIGAIVQGFPTPAGPRGDDCRIDVTTDATWDTPSLGVAYLEFVSGGGGSICSGSLINRIPSDGAPLLLTAGHCIDSEAEANSLQAYWFYQSDMFTDPNDAPVTVGATLLAVDTVADTSLLALLDDLPGGVIFNGWNTEFLGLGWNGTIIHHPAGTQKAISYGEFQAYTVAACGNGWNTWFFPLFNGGQEGGSSGGPVFRDAGQDIRAVVSCSSDAGCGPSEWCWQGSLRHGYDTIGWFMNVANDVWVDIGNAGTERGTQANPWDELIEAYYGVPNGGTVHIVAGSYPAFDFDRGRAMTLTSVGGTAVIGN